MTVPRPEAVDDAWVASTVVSLNFPKPKPDYLAGMRAYLTPRIPAGFDPSDRYHRATNNFLREEGIWGLHHPDDNVRAANLLLTSLKPRYTVEQLLLGHLDPRDVAKKVNARFNEHQTAASIEAYRHYYWNVGLLRVEEWNEALKEYDQLNRGVAILQVGPAMALHMTGFNQTIETKVMLRQMLEGVYFDFKEWQAQPRSFDKTKAMALQAKAACQLDFQLSQADSALRESLKAFEQFRMKHAQMSVVDIQELAPGGNFSGSGVKLLEQKPQTEFAPDGEED
jgi:hypothetical protein